MKEFFKRKKDGGAEKADSGNNPRLGSIAFAFSTGGKKHTVSVENMPEDVRAYFEELGRQMREEIGAGAVTMDNDHMPDYVADYLHEHANRYLKGMDEDEIREARLADLPRELVEESFYALIDRTFKRYAEKYPKCGEDLRTVVNPLKLILKILLYTDEDWQALDVNEASRLYSGVCMAMMEAVITASALNSVGWEDRKDEENT